MNGSNRAEGSQRARGLAREGARRTPRLIIPIVAIFALLGGFGGALVTTASAGADGNTFYVSDQGTDGGDCLSSTAPCATITYALGQASPGDTIDVSGTIDDNPTVNTSVTIMQMPGGSPAVVNGGANGSVFTINGKLAISVNIVGLTIENGESSDGGGITDFGDPTVTVSDSTIADDTTSGGGQGGGIYNNGTLNISGSTITDDSNEGGGQGGGIDNEGTATVTDSTISENSVDEGGQGGGIYNDGTATVSDSTISGNSVWDGGQGAGIDNEGSLTVANSTIAGNSLPGAGGGQGGGIYNDSSATVVDSTISGNSAENGGQGGGIYNNSATPPLRLLQSIDSPSKAKSISQTCQNCNQAGGTTTTTLAGDIIATPAGAPAGGECAGGDFTDAGYNVDDDGSCGLSDTSDSDDSTIDGYLGSLADNGGPSETIALLPGSVDDPDPAQAVIPANFTAVGQTTASCSQPDQRGFGRGAPCDMGSYALTEQAITSSDSASFSVGQSGSFQITDDGPSAAKFFEFGALPDGVTLSSTGLLSGIPASGTGGTYPITVVASDGLPPKLVQKFVLTVDASPSITSGQSTTFSVGQPGTFEVTTAGAPTASLIEIGTLPSGVTFTDNGDGTGTLSGMPGPNTIGVYPVSIIANNGIGSPDIEPLTLTVDQDPAVTSADRAGFTLGQPGSFTVTSKGFPVPALQLDGTLPSGLSFSDNGNGSATISGTPHHLTTSPIVLSVVAVSSAGSVASPLTLSVSSGAAWMAGSDGAVYPAGTATSYGSMQAYTLNRPVVGTAATPDGGGYWLVASDGGIFNFGDAGFFGSTGSIHLNQPIVGMAATPDGKGYWLVASDGGIFSFGDAGFFGSTGAIHLNRPIAGMAAMPDGGGYRLVASDGGVFSFGDAGFFGSVATAGLGALNSSVVGIVSSADGLGYSLATAQGDLIPFGDGVAGGGLVGLRAPIVAVSGP